MSDLPSGMGSSTKKDLPSGISSECGGVAESIKPSIREAATISHPGITTTGVSGGFSSGMVQAISSSGSPSLSLPSPFPGVVSILVIAGTGRPYLESALRSLVSQDVGNWEAIVLECCEHDYDRKNVLDQVEKVSDSRVRVVRYDGAYGFPPFASKKWNFGLRYTNGELIGFLDDDDMKEQDWLRRMSYPFNDASLSTTICGGYVVDKYGVRQGRLFGEPSFDRAVLLLPNFTSTGQMIVRRSTIDDIGGFDESLGCAEDWDFCIMLSNFPWKYVDGVSCLKRDSVNTSTDTHSSELEIEKLKVDFEIENNGTKQELYDNGKNILVWSAV